MSQFFQSDQVQTNLQDIFETYQDVANKTSQLGKNVTSRKIKSH